MKKYTVGSRVDSGDLGAIDIYVSSDVRREESIDEIILVEDATRLILSAFLNYDLRYREYINLYSKYRGLKNTAILSAHGDIYNGEWMYADGKGMRRVQNWIKARDGDYASLLLFCCNPGFKEVTTKKSLILVGTGKTSIAAITAREGKIEFYIPEIGYVDGYTIDYELRALREKMD